MWSLWSSITLNVYILKLLAIMGQSQTQMTALTSGSTLHKYYFAYVESYPCQRLLYEFIHCEEWVPTYIHTSVATAHLT